MKLIWNIVEAWKRDDDGKKGGSGSSLAPSKHQEHTNEFHCKTNTKEQWKVLRTYYIKKKTMNKNEKGGWEQGKIRKKKKKSKERQKERQKRKREKNDNFFLICLFSKPT